MNDISPEKPLRIGLLTDVYLPLSNGVTHVVSLLARRLARLGHEPHVFTFASPIELRITPEGLMSETPHFLRVPPRATHDEIDDGVHLHHAPAMPLAQTEYFFGVRYPVWMKRRLAEMDLLHVHHPFISGRLALRLRQENQPILFTNHTRYDIYSHYVSRVVPFVPQQTIGQRLTHRVARFANHCDAVIAPSQTLSRVLAEWGITTPIRVVPNGIELERFHAAQRAATRRENAPPTAVYLGRLAPEKNVAELLRAFAATRKIAPDAQLKIIGDGPLEEELKNLARELHLEKSVTFCGALPYEKVPAALAECDVFASHSTSEVHPLTFIEAMAAGLPCLGVPSPGVSDTIQDGENGWLALPPNFARVLASALSDSSERRRRAAIALKSSAAYAIDETVESTLALYREMLQAAPREAVFSSEKV